MEAETDHIGLEEARRLRDLILPTVRKDRCYNDHNEVGFLVINIWGDLGVVTIAGSFVDYKLLTADAPILRSPISGARPDWNYDVGSIRTSSEFLWIGTEGHIDVPEFEYYGSRE